MFRTLIYPSSGACDCVDELPHRSSCSQFVVCWSFCCGCYLVVFVLRVSACKTNTTKYQPQQKLQHTTNWEQDDRCGNSSTQSQAPEDVILMSETCWAHNKWNKIASDIKLVFHSSTNTTKALSVIFRTNILLINLRSLYFGHIVRIRQYALLQFKN